jgi:dipeptidyl aminopeptidase/acylaminoacyl peptidase
VRKRLLALLFTAMAAGAAQQPWEPADLWKWRTASGARIRADGQWVVYAEGWSDRAANASYSNLWAVSTGEKTRVRMTDGAWRDWSPQWSPDGTRIAWLREQGGAIELRVRKFEGNDELVAASAHVDGFAWSPDGKSIAFTEEGRWFVVAANGGAARLITAASLKAVGEPAWMPDGRAIVSAAEDHQIYALGVAGGAPRCLTTSATRNEGPVVSPDGARIAYLATDARPRSYSIRKLVVMNADGSGAKVLAGTLDRDATSPQWSSDSRTVYFLADDHGATHVYAGRAEGTARQVTTAAERLAGLSLADNGHVVSVRATAAAAEEVVTFAVDVAPTPVVLASPNRELIAQRETGAAQEIQFESAGKTVQGWMIRPASFDASKKYPLLLDIADAPRRMWGVEYSPEAQILAARGYVVLRVNPRGTPGYGEEFGYLLPSRLPGDDADDLLGGVDAAIPHGVDARRVSIKGGLTAAWLIGHTDRFQAAVTRHVIVDWTLDVLTAPDGAQHARDWLAALPWEQPEQYAQHSPISYAQNFKTPVLVLAGNVDAQSEELYGALRERKVDCELVRIEDGPGARVAELEATLRWIGRK